MDNLYDVMFARGLEGGGGGGFTPTQSQLDAMNSGITEELVTQIGTNETNILLKADKTTTDSLQNQIDQIAQTAGTGTADTEIGQARVGTDGTSYNTLKERIDTENNALAEEIDYLNQEIYGNSSSYCKITEIPNGTTVTNSSASITNTSSRVGILVASNSSYDTYYVVTDRACEIFFKDIESNYLALCYGKYEKTETQQDGIVIFASNPQRLRRSENNLPTAENKLSVPSGTAIAITVTKGGEDIVYGLSYKIISSSFSKEVVDRSGEIFTFENGIKITDIENVVKLGSYSGSATTTQPNVGILLTNNASYDTYYIVIDKPTEIYVDNIQLNYFAISYGADYTDIVQEGGNKVLLCSNPARVRKSEGNLPTYSNKLSLNVGNVVAFTVPTGENATVYGLGKTKVIKQSFKSEILNGEVKNKYIQYKSGAGIDSSTETVDIYIPTATGYIKYIFAHTINAEKNANIWRIAKAVQCDSSFKTIKDCTAAGEWECAVKIKGRDDFSGGYVHGDEIQDSITFFVDGAMVDISSYTDLTKVDYFNAVQTSDLVDPDDGTTVIARHGSNHIFTNSGLEITQTVTWSAAVTLVNAYLAMFPPLKSLTDKLITNKDFETVSLPALFEEPDITTATLFSNTEEFTANFSIKEYPVGIGDTSNTFLCTDNNGENYNKCYYTTVRGTDYNTTIGELWKSSAYYNIQA